MKFNRIVLCLLAAVLLGGTVAAHAAAPAISALWNDGDRTLNVRIVTEPSQSKKLNVYILKEDVDYAEVTNTNIEEVILGLRTLSGVGGVYETTFKIGTDAEESWYRVIITDYLYNAVTGQPGIELDDRAGRFYLASTGTVNSSVVWMNGASATDLAQISAGVSGSLGLAVPTDFAQLKDKIGIYMAALRTYEYGGEFKTDASGAVVDKIRTAFDNAVTLAKINSYPAADLSAILEANAAAFGLDISGDYADCKDAVAEIFVSVRSVPVGNKSPLASLQEDFRKALAVAALNAAGREAVKNTLVKYNDVFEVDLTSNYASLDPVEVGKALSGKGFTSVLAVQNAFTARVAELVAAREAAKNNTTSPSRGGGGGGGTSVYSVGVNPGEEPAFTVPSLVTNETKTTAGFTDVAHVEWAWEAIEYLAENGIISGMGDGAFDPDANVTREQFVKMLILAFDLNTEVGEADFNDVSKEEWYYPYIVCAVQKGLVKGIGDGVFGVGERIARQDMAVMAYRALEIIGAELGEVNEPQSFEDSGDIADYSKESVDAMQKAGVINGVGDNLFAPKAFATRAEAAKILYGLIGGVMSR